MPSFLLTLSTYIIENKAMAKEIITIIDYGSGNLRSAAKAFEHMVHEENLNAEVRVSGNPNDIKEASRIVLPGQGAFGDCMDSLSGIDGMIETLEDNVISHAKPFLGICVGMQLLADKGLEKGEHAGLGWIGGSVEPLKLNDSSLKIPHMGWNDLHLNAAGQSHPVLQNAEDKTQTHDYYFVHSFRYIIKDTKHDLASCDYGGNFCAIVGKDNVIGMQFHPEKSQKNGLRLIGNFLKWTP